MRTALPAHAYWLFRIPRTGSVLKVGPEVAMACPGLSHWAPSSEEKRTTDEWSPDGGAAGNGAEPQQKGSAYLVPLRQQEQ